MLLAKAEILYVVYNISGESNAIRSPIYAKGVAKN